MKNFFWGLLNVVLIGIVVFVYLELRSSQDAYNQIMAEHKQAQELFEQERKSLQEQLEEAKAQTDTIEKEIIHVIKEKEVIKEELEKLPPDEQLSLFDDRTGEHPASFMTEDHLAITPMERIVSALEIIERERLTQTENALLRMQIVAEQREKGILEESVELRDKRIDEQDETIDKLLGENQGLSRMNNWLKGGVAALIIYIAISN